MAIRQLAARICAPNPLQLAVALPIAIAVLAAVLRLHGLSDKPLWYDEIVSWNRARLPIAELIVDALRHKHYPTYFLLLRPFASGHINEWMLRLPSAVFGAVCALLVTRLAIDMRGALAGLVAGLLMALSPSEVQFGQEARAYTLISCLVLVAIWGLVRIAQQPGQAALPMTRPEALRGPWAAYLLGTTGALLAQNNTVPWLLASNLAFIAIVHRATAGRNGLLRNWVWTQAVILLVWLPVLVIMFSTNRGAVFTGLDWLPKPTWETIRSIVAAVYLFRISDMMTFELLPTPLPEFGVAVVMLGLYGAWRLKSDPPLLAVIGLAFAAMPITILVISIFHPALVPRYLLWSTGPFFVMAGIGAATSPARFSPLIAASVAVGAAISLWPYYSSETKPRWDQAAVYLASNVRPPDVIVVEHQSVEFVVDSYAEPLRFGSKFLAVSRKSPHVARFAANGGRTWVVYGRIGQGAEESEEQFRRKWAVLGNPDGQVRFGSHILILRFDNSVTAPQGSFTTVQIRPNDGMSPLKPDRAN